MSGKRLSPRTSADSVNDANMNKPGHGFTGRGPAGSLGAKARNSMESLLHSKPEQLESLQPPSKPGVRRHTTSIIHDDVTTSHRRYRSKSAHTKRFQQLVESSRAKPNGVLAIHIKVGHIHDIDSDGEIFAEGARLYVYLRILCVDYVKYSRVYAVDETPTTIIFDELKHFYINTGSMKPDSFCFVRFEILAFEESKRSMHRVLAAKEISLLQIVKSMYGSANLELWRDEDQVAEVEIEACFATGALGYGYSSLFDIPDHSPKVQLGWSMFCRLAPPLDRSETRQLASSGEIIACRETARPGVINFTRHAVLKPVGQGSRTVEPVSPIVGGMIGRRLAQRQVAYSHLTTRRERLKFLREFVIHPLSQAEETLISEDAHYFEELNLRRTTIQTDDARARFSIFTSEPEGKAHPDDAAEVMAAALHRTPSLTRRRQVIEGQKVSSEDDWESGQKGRPSTTKKT